MKKYIVATILIVVLVGIAYVKAIFSDQRAVKNRPSASETAPAEEPAGKEAMAALIDSLRAYYIDSLYIALSDSSATNPPSLLEKQDEIVQRADSLVIANQELALGLQKSQAAYDSLLNEYGMQTLTLARIFYKNEVALLPKDLSGYEREVSIKEIKSKMKSYFNLSDEQFDSIGVKHR